MPMFAMLLMACGLTLDREKARGFPEIHAFARKLAGRETLPRSAITHFHFLDGAAVKATNSAIGIPAIGWMSNVASAPRASGMNCGRSFLRRYGIAARIPRSVQRFASPCGVVTINEERG